jgi:hypothetical protein
LSNDQYKSLGEIEKLIVTQATYFPTFPVLNTQFPDQKNKKPLLKIKISP